MRLPSDHRGRLADLIEEAIDEAVARSLPDRPLDEPVSITIEKLVLGAEKAPIVNPTPVTVEPGDVHVSPPEVNVTVQPPQRPSAIRVEEDEDGNRFYVPVYDDDPPEAA
jgi:hypothetical protein